MREQIVCLPAQGAAGALGQHHEGDRPAAGAPAEDAVGVPGQPVVRTELRGGYRVREGRPESEEPGTLRPGSDHDPRPAFGCRPDHGPRCAGAERVAGWTRGEQDGGVDTVLLGPAVHVPDQHPDVDQPAQ